MKKIVTFGLVAAVGTTMALASSLGVPWFIDDAAANAGVPPTTGVLGLVFLKNNEAFEVNCSIVYYNSSGVELIPTPINTFSIPANSSIAFRPVASDPSTLVTVDAFGNPVTGAAFGQEGPVGFLVPNRPAEAVQPKKNGSCVISWSDAGTDANSVQGQYTQYQTFTSGAQGNRLPSTVPLVLSTAHTLPAGS